MSSIKDRCKELLREQNINLDSEVDFEINGEIHTLSFHYIIDTFMQASDESQQFFLAALEKSIKAKESGVKKFFEGMGQLLLMTHLSKNIEMP